MRDEIILNAVTVDGNALATSLVFNHSQADNRKIYLYAHGTFGGGNVSFTTVMGGVDVELLNLTGAGGTIVEVWEDMIIKATLAGSSGATITAGLLQPS